MALSVVAAAIVLFAWIRWERRGGPSPESDLDLPALFSPARERGSGDLPPEPGIAGPVHLAHPAGAERSDDLVGAEPGSCGDHGEARIHRSVG